MRDILLADKMH